MLGIRAFFVWSTRLALWLVLILFWTIVTGVLAAGLVSYRLAVQQPSAGVDVGRETLNPDEASVLDFYQAAGFTEAELATYLRQVQPMGEGGTLPVELTLQNARGDYLSQGRVVVRFNGGEYRLLVGDSGLIRLQLGSRNLNGLRIIPPTGFTILKQRSIPLGSAYEPEQELDAKLVPSPIIWDGKISYALFERLTALKSEGRVIPYSELREQLRRKYVEQAYALPAPKQRVATPEELYVRCRDAVVVVGTLTQGGGTRQAAGVILSSEGLVATAYHVLDRPDAISRGVMTADGRVFAIEEVVAASRSDDLALFRIAAHNLTPIPLSQGDRVGAEVLMVSHPGGAFYMLTEGRISRYWAATHHGQVSIKMSVTADFADGASGGPLFNRTGALTGLVSWTNALSNQMVVRHAAPVAALQALLHPPSKPEPAEEEKSSPQPPADTP